MAVFPPHLKKTGTIGIVAPSRWPDPQWVNAAINLFESRGYKVVVHPHCALRDGQFAGSDRIRANALMSMFLDPKIDAIVCARGGTGANRMVDLLDFKKIKKHPKPFVGFSDITVLLNAITKKAGFVTYHGPMGWNFAHDPHPRTIDDLFSVLSVQPQRKQMTYKGVLSTRVGKAKGKLVGGNLCLLQSLLGTEYEWSAKDGILFIEDIDEPLYQIDRILNQFRLAGKFKDVKAVLVGEFMGLKDMKDDPALQEGNPYGYDLMEIVHQVVPAKIPVCFNFPCGHGNNLTTLPVGAMVQASFTKRSVKLAF